MMLIWLKKAKSFDESVGNNTGFKNSRALYLINNPSTKLPYNKFPSLEKAWKAFNKGRDKNGNIRIVQGLVNRRAAEWKIYSEGKYET